ncbi:MAG: competence/damage-inducible protein A [Streptococcus sp.]|nr:competence/damage-inducible protein A [Streptococcus sp.]
MKAEIIAVGTELLTGQIVNTNAQFLSEKFAEIGIDVFFQTSVGDNASRLLEVLSIAKQRSNLVVLCGGLGPTDDDLTKQTLAMFLNRKLVFNVEANQKLDDFFATRPTYSRTPNNERQAQLIEGSHAIQNITGLAVGGMVTVDGVTYVVLPGPPSELKPMVNQGLIPLLTTNHNSLYSRVLRFFGIGESQLVTVLDDIIEQQSDPTVAPYAKIGEVTLRISTKAESQEEADFKLDKFESEILSRRTLNNEVLRDLLYGYGEDNSLPKVVFNLLREHSKTITAAESLTGGLFQSSIADFSGASKIFNGGYVTYSLPEKSRMLDIPIDDLEKNGVVSQFTAEQMANQARKLTKSDYAVSLTGVAGPDSLEGHLPGTVFIGLASKDKVYSRKVIIGGRSRSDIRYIATLHAFNLVRQTLLNK